MPNPLAVAATCALLASASVAQEPDKPAPPLPRPAAAVAQERLFLETALLRAAPAGSLTASDFSIDIRNGGDGEPGARATARIAFASGRDAPHTPAGYVASAVERIEADAGQGWRLETLEVRFDERHAGSDAPASVRSMVFVRPADGGPRVDGARALALVDSTAAAAKLVDVAYRTARIQMVRVAGDDGSTQLLRVEIELVGDGFRGGFAAVASAFEAACRANDSPFAAVVSNGRERVLRKGPGAAYELEIELRSTPGPRTERR